MPLFSKPQYSTVTVKKKDIPKGLWTKCPKTGEIIYNKELEQNQMVVPKSGYHFPLRAHRRIEVLLDAGSFQEHDAGLQTVDALAFKDVQPYASRLERYRKNTGLNDAVVCGTGTIGGRRISIGAMDYYFAGASMGVVVGEKITRAIERAAEEKTPLLLVIASGGARMQEAIFSLMQMTKTSSALNRLKAAGQPYIAVLTHPTTGGVTASFATLADVILAEPEALIGFAGPRVIRETTKEDLPEGFQTSEFLLEHGLVDQIVHRHELRDRIIALLGFFAAGQPVNPVPATRTTGPGGGANGRQPS
ncbi:MAG: acetyl-CoA carboxylase, carboxyltransferase subunit beta [Opitutales bacterium]